MSRQSSGLLIGVEPQLRQALCAAYGIEVGLDCAADAMAWGWEHRDRLATMDNPAGYIYRVGQTAPRSYLRKPLTLPAVDPVRIPEIEPGLVPVLEALTESQRVVVLAVHSFGWSQQEVADLLELSHSSVRTHLARGMEKLRRALQVSDAQ